MQAIGFFREVDHGLPKGPSLGDAVAEPMPEELRPGIVRYLRECPVFFATAAKVPDVMDPDAGAVLSIDVHSDGRYVWPDQAAHYVERYGARLSPEFVEHVLSQLGPPARADLPDDLTTEIQEAMRAQR